MNSHASDAEMIANYLNRKISIARQIQKGPGINIFSRIGNGWRMIPTFSLVQTFLNIKFAENAVILRPRIGYATHQDLEQNGKSQTREVSVPYPGICYHEADYYPIFRDDEMMYHDAVYHGWMASQIPQKFQRGFIIIADILKEMKNQAMSPYEDDLLQHLYERFIDMEVPSFHIGISQWK